jgi:hypothetical protein
MTSVEQRHNVVQRDLMLGVAQRGTASAMKTTCSSSASQRVPLIRNIPWSPLMISVSMARA